MQRPAFGSPPKPRTSILSFATLAVLAASGTAFADSYPASISEESGRNRRVCPLDQEVIFGVKCTGSFCDNVHMACQTSGNIFDTPPTSPETRTPWVESGGITQALCGNGKFAVGMECRGGNCDDVRLICKDSGYAHTNCSWHGKYSEEHGWFRAYNKGLAGVECSGRHCDDKKYYVCERTTTHRPAELRVTLRTGGDDLRGGDDNLNIGVIVDGQIRYWFNNVNARRKWDNNSTHTVVLPENNTFAVADVEGLVFRTTFGGGLSGDNWNLDSVVVNEVEAGAWTELYTSHSGMEHRFTGELPEHEVFWRGNFLKVTIWTGGDDLRGGDDNANLYVVYTDGERKRFENVNEGGTWQNDLPQTVYLQLRDTFSAVGDLEEVGGLFVETTVSGGPSGDNWNIDRVRVIGHVGSAEKTLYDASAKPLVRITGNNRQKLFKWASKIDPSGPVFTDYRPDVHGYNFDNGFKESYFYSLVQNKGLCGGMSYSSLDYYHDGQTIPQQNFRPAPGTELREYIYQRQELSIVGGAFDQWVEYTLNPFGWRNDEFFNWGMQFGSGRLGELIAHIENGEPVPLGMRSCGSSCSSDHQVVAYGYRLGDYYGDPADSGDIEIYIYDPRTPGDEVTLTANKGALRWETDNGRAPWLAYFVDSDYYGSQRTPPQIQMPDRILVLELQTGEADFRREDAGHGGASFDVILHTNSGLHHFIPNAYGGGPEEELLAETTEFVVLDVSGVHRDFVEDLESIEIVTDFAGGIAGENWDLRALGVRAQYDDQDCDLLEASMSPSFWYTSQYPGNQYWMQPGACFTRDQKRP